MSAGCWIWTDIALPAKVWYCKGPYRMIHGCLHCWPKIFLWVASFCSMEGILGISVKVWNALAKRKGTQSGCTFVNFHSQPGEDVKHQISAACTLPVSFDFQHFFALNAC